MKKNGKAELKGHSYLRRH